MNSVTRLNIIDPRIDETHYPNFVVDKPSNTPLMHDSAYSSPRPSPAWPSSDNMSDSCSGSGTWSSPGPSIAYSPSPRPTDFHVHYSAWSRASSGHTLQPFTSLNQVQLHSDAAEYYPQTVVCQPYYPQQYFDAPFPETQALGVFGVGGWVATECSRASSERISEASPAPTSGTSVALDSPRQSCPSIKQETSEQEESLVHTCSTSPRPAHLHPPRSRHNGGKVASFPCPLQPYGCSATFTSKNEWKRHLNTQHLHLSTWRCDLCPSKTSSHQPHSNDFNRKDLFVQHLRGMHCTPSASASTSSPPRIKSQRKMPNTPTALEEAERRCHVALRSPPPHCCCLFCDSTFSGADAWMQRTDHVARHFEKMRRDGLTVPEASSWNRDSELERWLLGQGVLVVVGGRNGRGRVKVRTGRGRM